MANTGHDRSADDHPAKGAGPVDKPRQRRRVRSMHEDVPVWYDCCSCEAEPYWAELADEPESERNDTDRSG